MLNTNMLVVKLYVLIDYSISYFIQWNLAWTSLVCSLCVDDLLGIRETKHMSVTRL